MTPSKPFQCLRAPWVAFALAVLLPGTARAAGVAILKEQTFHRDSTAQAVPFQQIIYSTGPYLRIVSGHRNIDVVKSKLVDFIEVTDQVPSDIGIGDDLSGLRELLVEMRRFSTRYPTSAPYLRFRIASLSGHLARFDAGELRFEGVWMTRDAFAKLLENRQIDERKRRQQEIEQLVFDEAQKEKGLVLVNGKWMTEEEARNRLPTEHTELSNALWPLMGCDTEGARLALENLAALASRQNGTTKVRTERLHRLIKNLFLAETRLSRQIVSSNAAEAKAAQHERRATQWLKPNAFGTIQKDAARDSQDRAAALRNQADRRLAACRAELLAQLHEADIVTGDFLNLREHRVALLLGDAVRTISMRNITAGEFHSSLPDESLASIRNRIDTRN